MSSERGTLVLLFRHEGTAELTEDGELVWVSDMDEEFRDQFENELLNEDDAEEVLEYLEEEDYLDSSELPDVIVEVEEPDDSAITLETRDGDIFPIGDEGVIN